MVPACVQACACAFVCDRCGGTRLVAWLGWLEARPHAHTQQRPRRPGSRRRFLHRTCVHGFMHTPHCSSCSSPYFSNTRTHASMHAPDEGLKSQIAVGVLRVAHNGRHGLDRYVRELAVGGLAWGQREQVRGGVRAGPWPTHVQTKHVSVRSRAVQWLRGYQRCWSLANAHSSVCRWGRERALAFFCGFGCVSLVALSRPQWQTRANIPVRQDQRRCDWAPAQRTSKRRWTNTGIYTKCTGKSGPKML